MKKIISVIMFGCLFVLMGCNRQQSTKSDSQITSQSDSDQSSTLISEEYKIYKNEKYNFTIQYPNNWEVNEDKAFAGPIFRPENISIENIQNEKINKDRECFFSIAFLQTMQNKTLLCKDILGELTLGANTFTKCSLKDFSRSESISYRLVHPKTGNILQFDYINNSSCKTIFEKSLETLTFN